jgi:uncharacterized membrane protein
LAARLYLIALRQMKVSSNDQKAISLILIYLGLLFFLIGVAAQLKTGYQCRAEISTTGFVAAVVLAGLGVIVFLFSFRKKQS